MVTLKTMCWIEDPFSKSCLMSSDLLFLKTHAHTLAHLSSEKLILKANSPSFVRGALSPVAGIQFCNEQQLARRAVLGSCIPHPDECVICCLFSTRFCSDSELSSITHTYSASVFVAYLLLVHSLGLHDC